MEAVQTEAQTAARAAAVGGRGCDGGRNRGDGGGARRGGREAGGDERGAEGRTCRASQAENWSASRPVVASVQAPAATRCAEHSEGGIGARPGHAPSAGRGKRWRRGGDRRSWQKRARTAGAGAAITRRVDLPQHRMSRGGRVSAPTCHATVAGGHRMHGVSNSCAGDGARQGQNGRAARARAGQMTKREPHGTGGSQTCRMPALGGWQGDWRGAALSGRAASLHWRTECESARIEPARHPAHVDTRPRLNLRARSASECAGGPGEIGRHG